MRISFTGDVMCEPMLIEQSRRQSSMYDFSGAFKEVEKVFAKSDYVVANLETPIAGEALGLTRSLFSFNAPVEFIEGLESSGVSCVTIANNHSFDRGVEGAIRTVRALEESDLEHVGMSISGAAPKPLYKNVDGESFALLSYTYGVNQLPQECDVEGQDRVCIGLLRSQGDRQNPSSVPSKRSFLKRLLLRITTKEQRIRLKKRLGLRYYSAYRDDTFDEQAVKPFLERLSTDIKAAKEKADVVVCCLHMGGQFNAEPGKFSEHVVEVSVQAGCDAVIASHPHVAQKAVVIDGKPIFYSLGNFSMFPDSVYVLHEHHPEYGLIAHLDMNEGAIRGVSFSIIKMVVHNRKLEIWPIDVLYRTLEGAEDKELLESEVAQIYERVTGHKLEDGIIRSEYTLLN